MFLFLALMSSTIGGTTTEEARQERYSKIINELAEADIPARVARIPEGTFACNGQAGEKFKGKLVCLQNTYGPACIQLVDTSWGTVVRLYEWNATSGRHELDLATEATSYRQARETLEFCLLSGMETSTTPVIPRDHYAFRWLFRD